MHACQEIIKFDRFKAVKAERDSLKKKASHLKADLDETTNQNQTLSKKIDKLEKALSEEVRKREGLEAQLSENQEFTTGLETQGKCLEDELKGYKTYLDRLESEKVAFEGREITLKQVDEHVVRSYGAEIERRTTERLDKLANELWPAWHKEHHGEQVRLEAEERVNELAREQLWDGMFKALNSAVLSERPFQVTCDKCNTSFEILMSSTDVEALARTGEAEIECLNESCIDEQ